MTNLQVFMDKVSKEANKPYSPDVLAFKKQVDQEYNRLMSELNSESLETIEEIKKFQAQALCNKVIKQHNKLLNR